MARDYLALIPTANRDRPKFTAVVDLLTKPFASTVDLLATANTKVDIETAVGEQLDTLGEWIGQPRRIQQALDILVFGFEGMAAVDTFGEEGDPSIGATFYEEGAGVNMGITVLDDAYYRFLLKAKITRNETECQPEDLMAFLEYLFGVPCWVGDGVWTSNMFSYSEEFDNAYWTKIRSSITPNASVAPDGTTTMDALIEDTTAGATHLLYQTSLVVKVGKQYTFSVFVKSLSANRALEIQVGSSAFGVSQRARFDPDLGTIILVQGGGVASIEDVGGGIYRCILTTIPATAETSPDTIFCLALAGGITYDGDGVSGLYLWGAQMEETAEATNYLKTTSAPSVGGGDMTMTVTIGRALTQTEDLMVTQLDMLPRPAGVDLIIAP